jgi:hypothetical protein
MEEHRFSCSCPHVGVVAKTWRLCTLTYETAALQRRNEQPDAELTDIGNVNHAIDVEIERRDVDCRVKDRLREQAEIADMIKLLTIYAITTNSEQCSIKSTRRNEITVDQFPRNKATTLNPNTDSNTNNWVRVTK